MAITELNYKKLLYKDGNSSPIFSKVNNLTFALNWSRSNNASLENWFVKTAPMANYGKNLRILKLLNGQSFKGIQSFYNAFQDVYNLTDIYTENWDLSNATNLARMFSGSSKLKNIYQIENWNVGKVINLSSTFAGCNFTTLNLENWDTSNVINMSWMFHYSNKITTLNISTWNTSKVNNLSSAFYHLDKLNALDISNWNTSNIENLADTFFDCGFNGIVNLMNWDTSKVNNLANTFWDCCNLKTLEVSNWNTSNVDNLYRSFCNCFNLKTLDVSNWNTSNVNDLGYAFYRCENLTTLDVSNWNTSKITDLIYTFEWCSKLKTLDVSNWNTSNVNNLTGTFYCCSNINVLNVSNWNINKVTSLYGTFSYCSKLTSLDVSNWNTSNVNDLTSTFEWCSNLINLDVANWNTNKVTSLYGTFNGCSNLTNLNLAHWNVDKAISLVGMMNGCNNLTNLNIGIWNINNANNISAMFRNTGKRWNAEQDIYGLDFNWIQNWNMNNIVNMSNFLNNAQCGYFPLYNINNIQPYISTGLPNIYWNTDKVTDISWAFAFESARPKSAEIQPNLYVNWGIYGTSMYNNTIHSNWFFNFSKIKNAVGTFSGNSIYFWYLYDDGDYTTPLTGADYWLYLNNTENVVNVKNMFASDYNWWAPFYYDAYSDAPTFNIQNTILNFNNVSDASYLFYNYKPVVDHTEFYEEGEGYIFPRKILPTLILNNIVNLAYAYYNTRTPIIDTSYWNLSKVTNIRCMFSQSYALDNNSLKNIANALLIATNIPATQKNLFINNAYGPFNKTTSIHEGMVIPKIINNTTVGTDLVTQLRAAGWYVPE